MFQVVNSDIDPEDTRGRFNKLRSDYPQMQK